MVVGHSVLRTFSGMARAKPMLRPENRVWPHGSRYLGAARAAITWRQRLFPTRYGPEFIAEPLQTWLKRVGIDPIRILPGLPRENGYNERFNGKFRQECLDAHWFMSLADARKKMETWRRYYNENRPHSAIGYNVPSSLIKPTGTSGPPVCKSPDLPVTGGLMLGASALDYGQSRTQLCAGR